MPPRELTPDERKRIGSVKTFIINELSQHFTVKQLARKAAIGEQKFQEGFYQLFGMKVSAYLQVTRMQTGRFLLSHTERTMKEIAWLCGYKEYKSFLKAYKNYFGVPAGSVRKPSS